MAKLLCKSFCVDDFITGAPDEENGFHILKELKNLCSMEDLIFRKWRTNSTILQLKIDQSDATVLSNQIPQTESVKILGMNWDTSVGKIYFNFEDIIVFAKSLTPTKRSVLKASAKLFDPYGATESSHYWSKVRCFAKRG